MYEPEDYERAIELLAAGALPLDRLITAVEPLERAAGVFGALEGDGRGDEDPGRLPRVNAAPRSRARRRSSPAAGAASARPWRSRSRRAGADIVGVSASLEPEGGEVGREVEARGRTLPRHRCDLGDRAAVHELVAALRRRPARSTSSSTTPARSGAARRPSTRDEDWDAVLEVNLTAQFVLARELGREMVERGRGKIVFVASLLSFQGGITVPGYAASKGGVAQLTKALANEWAARGVNVNAVAPGYIADRQHAGAPGRPGPLRADPRSASRPAAGASRTDIAGAVVFLGSPAADYVHGVVLPVDGGWLAR